MVDKIPRLGEMSMSELQDLASQAGVATKQVKKREDLVAKLQSLSNITELMQTWENSLPRLLSQKSPKELRDIAAKHNIEITKKEKKRKIIEILSTHPSASDIAEAMRKEAKLDRIKQDLEEVKGDIVKTVEDVSIPPLEDQSTDLMLKQALSLEVDFDHCEDLLDRARMRFEEKNFEGALSAAVEARDLAERCRREFEGSVTAYAILSAQKLIEECGKAGRNVEKAADFLRKAKRLYKEGEFVGKGELLSDLESISRSLFSAEVQRARDQMHSGQEFIRDVANLGADVRRAEEELNRSRDALGRSEYRASMDHAARAVELAEVAKQERLQKIEEALPAVVQVIEEAKHVGADMTEAERLVSKAKTALESKEFLLASELTKRAERAAMEGQQTQILKAMELRRRQVEKGQSIIGQIEPVLEEAESFGIDVMEARTLLQQAKDILAEGDYVNGTIFAKNAAEAAKKLEPKLVEERGKRGIAKPVAGVCASCGSRNLEFTDDGWSYCKDCRYAFRWRAPGGVWSRFKSLWKP